MIRQYADGDVDTMMRLWLDTNIQARDFLSPDCWRSNFDMVKEMLCHAETYVHEDGRTKQVDGFVGLNNDIIEGIFVNGTVQSKGIGTQLLDRTKELKSTLRLNVYQKNKRAIQFYLREGFGVQSEAVGGNTGEPEFIMVWNR